MPEEKSTGLGAGLKRLLATSDDRTLTTLRIALGVVMLPHGAQKALGLFGGYGFSATVAALGQQGIPAAVAVLVIAAEFLGALGLITGMLARVSAFGIASVMLGAILTVHGQYGFFMNWMGNAKGEGFEYHLLAIALAAPVIVRGAGAYSIDRLVSALRPAPRKEIHNAYA